MTITYLWQRPVGGRSSLIGGATAAASRERSASNLGRSRELPAQRHRWITTTLHRSGAVSVREIVDYFGVSATTARRDIEAIGQQEGRRVYGGLLYTRIQPAANPATETGPEEEASSSTTDVTRVHPR